MKSGKSSIINDKQRDHFLEHGWIHITNAIPPENIKRFVGDVWIRNGYDESDPATWAEEKVLMPRHREMSWRIFAPKAWAAICEVVGGEERIDQTIYCKATDSLIANYGREEYRNQDLQPQDLGNWHIDGNWFTHFLDSSEHSILCIVLFSDIFPRGGGTFISEDGLTETIHWLHARPQGCNPKFVDEDGTCIFDSLPKWNTFAEITGKAGDMYICHGFTPHSASKNHIRIPRFITSPRFVLRQPFNYNRADPKDYSLVELKTLRDLGVDSLPDWKITGTRERFASATKAKKDARVIEELARLKQYATKTNGVVDSIHANGVAAFHGWKGTQAD